MTVTWVEPKVEVQNFVPDEYVAACYYGLCNISGNVFSDTNSSGQYEQGADRWLYYNTACNKSFVVTGQDSPEPQANAFVVDRNWVQTGPDIWDGHFEQTVTPVYYFGGEHVSTMDSIRTHDRPNHS